MIRSCVPLVLVFVFSMASEIRKNKSEYLTRSHDWAVKYPIEEWPNCNLRTDDGRGRSIEGSCEKIVNCKPAVEAIYQGYHPPICYWERHQEFPLVCCPSVQHGQSFDLPEHPNSGFNDIFLSTTGCGEFTAISREPTRESYAGAVRSKPRQLKYQPDELDANPKWPWAVRICKDKEGKQIMQNGFLIDRQHIVTTAQLIASDESLPQSVRFSNGFLAEVSKTVVHKEFKSWVAYNDIAILRLKEPLADDFAQPICLPSKQLNTTTFSGITASMIGVSRTEIVSIVSHSWCADTYSKFSPLTYPKGITDQFICGGLQLNNEVLSGVGDSGSVVMVQNKENQHWTAVGLVSLDYKCAKPGFPGVYINLGYFSDWIHETIELL